MNLAEIMVSKVMEHAKTCSMGLSDHTDPERMTLGFKCMCGQSWTIGLMRFKNIGSGSNIVQLLISSRKRESVANAISAGATMRDLENLETIHCVMDS